jgi:acyl transferase domain-containing protein
MYTNQASGVTSLIKAIMMLRKDSVPPHVGIKGRINHRLPPLDSIPVRLALGNKRDWPRSGTNKRRILINNFDAAVSFTLEIPAQL